jgi:hypothetical protein
MFFTGINCLQLFPIEVIGFWNMYSVFLLCLQMFSIKIIGFPITFITFPHENWRFSLSTYFILVCKHLQCLYTTKVCKVEKNPTCWLRALFSNLFTNALYPKRVKTLLIWLWCTIKATRPWRAALYILYQKEH